MTGHRRAHADLGGFGIAHFADQNHVRILAQGGTQHPGKGQLDFFVHLHLIDPGQTVFHRVFHRDDLLLDGVDLGQAGVQRGRLAGARRSGDQHHAAAAPDDLAKAPEHLRRHAELVQGEKAAALVKQAHHHRFAVLRGHGGNTHVDRLLAHTDIETAVLRQAFFRNIQTGHQLQAQSDGTGNFAVSFSLQVQCAVDAEADLQARLLRLDMDV